MVEFRVSSTRQIVESTSNGRMAERLRYRIAQRWFCDKIVEMSNRQMVHAFVVALNDALLQVDLWTRWTMRPAGLKRSSNDAICIGDNW